MPKSLDRLQKVVEQLKQVADGSHIKNATISTTPAADPGKPADKPHIRADTMSEVNLVNEDELKKGMLHNIVTGAALTASAFFSNPAHAASSHVNQYVQSLGKIPGVKVESNFKPMSPKNTHGTGHYKITVGPYHVNGNHWSISNGNGGHDSNLTVDKNATEEDIAKYQDTAEYLHQQVRINGDKALNLPANYVHKSVVAPATPTPDPDGKSVMVEKEQRMQSSPLEQFRKRPGGNVYGELSKNAVNKSEPGTPEINNPNSPSLTWKTRLGALVGALRKTPKVLPEKSDTGLSGGAPSLFTLLKKTDKINDIIEQAATQLKAANKVDDSQKKRFEFIAKDTEDKPEYLTLPSTEFEKIDTHAVPGGLYHHVATKGNHHYHTISFYKNPEAPAMAGVITADHEGHKHIRASYTPASSGAYLEKLNDRIKSNDDWKYDEPIELDARKHAENGWEGHHTDLFHGLVPDTTLQAPPSTISKWISFAGNKGDKTPRVITKEALEQFDPERRATENEVDQMKRSYFAHPTFTTAHREAAYSKLAHEVFNLGQYVPRTTVFRHPLSKKPWSVMEFIPGATAIRQHDVPEKLKEIEDNGDIYKMAIMNLILGNTDRHTNNILLDSAKKPHLIDHGLTFDYAHIGTDVLPQYAMNVLNRDMPESVHQWLWSIDGTELANKLHQMGAPTPIVMNAVGRLADARGWSNLVKHGSKIYKKEIKNRNLNTLLETMKARQLGIPTETRQQLQENIRREMTGIKPAKKQPSAGEAVTKINEQTGKATVVHPKDEIQLRHQDAVDSRRTKE